MLPLPCTITVTSPSITTLSLTEHDTLRKANDILTLWTLAVATISSSIKTGAGKRISWRRSTWPRPSILVPITAEINPLIRIPCTTGRWKEVDLAYAASTWRGFASPVSRAKSSTSWAEKALVREASWPTWRSRLEGGAARQDPSRALFKMLLHLKVIFTASASVQQQVPTVTRQGQQERRHLMLKQDRRRDLLSLPRGSESW